MGVAEALNTLLEPIRRKFTAPDLAALVEKAYPPAKPKIQADISRVNIKVGRVISAIIHPEAPDRLYIEQIDVGESEPRTIVSGLSGLVPLEKLINRLVLVVVNMKPSNFKGVASNGMVLAASNLDKSVVELIDPPTDSVPGDQVTFEGYEFNPDAVLNPKHKVFEKVAVDLKVEGLIAKFKDVDFMTGKGNCTTESIVAGKIG